MPSLIERLQATLKAQTPREPDESTSTSTRLASTSSALYSREKRSSVILLIYIVVAICRIGLLGSNLHRDVDTAADVVLILVGLCLGLDMLISPHTSPLYRLKRLSSDTYPSWLHRVYALMFMFGMLIVGYVLLEH